MQEGKGARTKQQTCVVQRLSGMREGHETGIVCHGRTRTNKFRVLCRTDSCVGVVATTFLVRVGHALGRGSHHCCWRSLSGPSIIAPPQQRKPMTQSTYNETDGSSNRKQHAPARKNASIPSILLKKHTSFGSEKLPVPFPPGDPFESTPSTSLTQPENKSQRPEVRATLLHSRALLPQACKHMHTLQILSKKEHLRCTAVLGGPV